MKILDTFSAFKSRIRETSLFKHAVSNLVRINQASRFDPVPGQAEETPSCCGRNRW